MSNKKSGEILDKVDEDPDSIWDYVPQPPQIITKFVKDKLKKARRGNLSWEEINDVLSSVKFGPRYRHSDFRYVAELIHLEHMLHAEQEAGPNPHGYGVYWGVFVKYLTEKYPDETEAIMDELDPERSHADIKHRIKAEKKHEREMETQSRNKSKRAAKEWWKQNRKSSLL
ncbi:MAG: hypothetical protein ACP5MX_03965 [Candidatus Micrarchaeia archaeon]